MTATVDNAVADLQRANAELRQERDEALAQKAALAEVLDVINRSPGDLMPVFQTIVEKAHALCDAAYGSLQLWDGERFCGVAMRGFPDAMMTALRAGYSPVTMPCQRLIEGESIAHCVDLAEIDSPIAREGGVKLAGIRTILYVALRKDGVLLGQIVAARKEVRPFTDKQISLVENFADQAVIAIESARLITETREALEQQTATAEVLGVINSSPGDLTPVFDAILDKAHTLCGAAHGSLQFYDGENLYAVATKGVSSAFAEILRRGYPAAASPASRELIAGSRFTHILDCTQVDHPVFRAGAELAGMRTVLFVPLRKDDVFLGLISAARLEVRAFTDKQISLLQNFAAQAVIAMENARLITETRERTADLQQSLEYQTATSDVLQVISRSTFDLDKIFETVVGSAIRLCRADNAGIYLNEGGQYRRAVGVAVKSPDYDSIEANVRILPGPGTVVGRAALEQRTVQIEDAWTDPLYEAKEDARIGGVHTMLGVPLLREGAPIGVLALARERTQSFSEAEIQLVTTFADQAVIAIENARLITETQEALDQQTATAEVLQVINASPGNLAPVFDAMLEKAMRLCGAAFGELQTYDGERFQMAALRGLPPRYAEFRTSRTHIYGPGTIPARLLVGERLIQVLDITVEDAYRDGEPNRLALADLGGARTVLAVPLLKDDALLGFIVVYRQEVRQFSDKQIALLENFAAQAVIAMENARLITETREALEQQTATAEVLQVINSSPGVLAPVFDAMLEKAMRLCEASFGFFLRYQGGKYGFAAGIGLRPEFAEYLLRMDQPGPHEANSRVVEGAPYVHIADMKDEDAYRLGAPFRRAIVDLGGGGTGLAVPMRKDNQLLGAFNLARFDVRPFTDKQVALVQNFAAQAVIAMENARLITETREALEQQTATAEVLQVINASPGALAPVFEAILEKAHSLCGAVQGAMLLPEGELFRAIATRNMPEAFNVRLREGIRGAESPLARPLMAGEPFSHIVDMAEIEHPMARVAAELAGARTVLSVALRKDDTLLGMIVAGRREVRPFSNKQIALLQNFAAQAVIAMENARLITETREALDQQTATAEVLGVINCSPGDLKPVFDAMLEKAMRLCEADFGIMFIVDADHLHIVAERDVPRALADYLDEEPPQAGSDSLLGQSIRARKILHTPDALEAEPYRKGVPLAVKTAELGGARALLMAPLLKDEAVLGVFAIFRQEVRSFSDKHIALLGNFAAQAVIAMENARLIIETREALEQQTATSDVLKVISQSSFDLEPVLQTVLDTTMRLCGNSQGSIFRLGEDGLYRQAVGSGMQREYYEIEAQQEIRPGSETLVGRTAATARPVQIADAWADPDYAPKEDARVGQLRSMLGVPLLREGMPIGVICTARTIVQPFTEKEIELVATFADQAVIAIENARLLGELRQRQAELRVTFDNMADGVVMFDEDLRLAAWNRNFQELLDLPDAVLAERPSYANYLRLLAERGEFGTEDIEAELGRRLENTDQEIRLERTRPDGRVIEVRRNAVPDGGFVLIYSDITERKRSEAEIRAARDTAEAAYRDLKAAQANLVQAEKMASLGQLTAGIAHEIKNPLNFVNNFAGLSVELLEELKEATDPAVATLDDDKRAEIDETMVMLTGNLEKIAEHGKRADNIVKSMLEHSRGVSGERREVDLNGLVEEALNLAYHGARAQDQSFNITLERDYAGSLKPIELAPQEMTRVLLNLFGNGFYAATKRARENSDGSFRPSVTVATRETADAVEVRVRDNGTGIPPEIRDKLFQPFFTTKPTGEGTGLGLSISYDIVTQQHGGTIAVESEPGAFTEFTIRLPRH
jgi:GAF domain-containing protein